MHYFEAEADIKASQAAVWSVLVDAATWPDWDSGVEAVEGKIHLGDKVTIRSQIAPGRAFPVKVSSLEAPELMTFTGGMPLGLFRGVRRYTLTAESEESTLFRMREEYTGPMVGLMWKSMPDLGASFTRFAAGLKERVEHAG